MPKFKKLISLFLALTMLLSVSACGKTAEEDASAAVGEVAEHTITVHSQGGLPLSGIDVYAYEDDTLTNLAAFGETDENGSLTLSLSQGVNYAVTLSSVPDGYAYEEIYRFDGTSADITLTSSLITGENLSAVNLGVGDVMVDFEVMTADDTTIKLSDLLAQKDMVLLNFWFSTCGPCANEFPYLQEAYLEYEDSVGIIALNPLEDNQTVATYQASMGLSFPMAACNASWSQTFNLSGYPTSVVIDRYGVICLIEVGAVTSLRPFTSMFAHFTAEDYQQTLYSSLSELVTTVKPTFTMASSDEIAAVFNGGDLDVSYRPETEGESAEYSWPFIAAEKNGETCLKATNQGIENSFAILYADIYLNAGQAVAFDYLASSEKGCDILYIIVDGEDVYGISGWDEVETWKTCYPWVALEDGYHEVAFCFLKDSDTNEADDTVYIKNLRTVDAAQIDAPTYIPRLAATSKDGFEYDYVDIFLNETDGYYHVGSEEGPLLLADLMNYSQFSEEQTLWDLVYNSSVTLDGVSLYDVMVNYFSYASNSSLSGVCTVNEELLQLLEIVDENFGFDAQDNREWLKCCKYYAVYGTDEQLADPIGGLARFSAFEAKLGVGVETNYFYYDRPIMPRGLLAAFTPTRSGVYRITSHTDSVDGVEGWIFTVDRETEAYTYAHDERMNEDSLNVSMVYYMEAGETYYIDIAFWDIYEVGYIYYDIEYIAAEYDLFRLGSPGYFTYDTNATGEHMYDLIAGGIDVVLGDDGIYYVDLGGGQKGSKLYCDFTGITGIFSQPLATVGAYNEDGTPAYDAEGNRKQIKGIIDLGGFDFSKTENDLYILSIIEKYDGDTEKADEYLKTLWGEDYDAYAEQYQLKDIYAGKYHGKGEDLTEQAKEFLDDIITSGPVERQGCVVVTKELAELLQLLMDKYTFSGVDHSWTKLCYYYDHLGPND